MKVALQPNWASSLSYDDLDRRPDRRDKAIFVGREQLLDPLVADIGNPAKSGAYLVSGHRGSGKTTLLVEALWRAQTESAPEAPDQFVVVLNVSEISASLEPGADREAEGLSIDPRRLLFALLRSLRNRIRSYEARKRKFDPDLERRVVDTYDKALAASYRRLDKTQDERIESREQRSSREAGVTAPYQIGAALTALAAAGFEASAWAAQPWLMHLLAGAAGLTSLWSFSRSRTLEKSFRQARTRETTLHFDNSLQQLENDLKDILDMLFRDNRRTVVVLEELDKIDDDGGAQLDAVIRYFKNLFTQAPALFFFLADKAYYDLVEKRIRLARASHSYALEHTFFTHRIFVGRPTTRDCLDYLAVAVVEAGYRSTIDRLYTEKESELTPEEERFARFVRTLLFRAANHLFDLKNELRRYVRRVDPPGDAVALVIDERTFSEDEAALGKFQNLVELKARAYGFGRGQSYANDALRDYLYAVFDDLGSTREQRISSFFPTASMPESGEQGGDRSLDWDEVGQITDAVYSLITDLYRGSAFQSYSEPHVFVWRRSAARAFHLERQLEQHETAHLKALQEMMAEVGFLAGGAVPAQPAASSLVSRLQQRIWQIESGAASLTLQEAVGEGDELAADLDRALDEAIESYLSQVFATYGFDPGPPLSTGPAGAAVYRLAGGQSPGGPPPPAAVFLVVGPFERFAGQISGEAEMARVSLVQVLRSAVPGEALDGTEAWDLLTRQPPEAEGQEAASSGPAVAAAVSLDVIPLDEGLAAEAAPAEGRFWGQSLGDALRFRLRWVGESAEPMHDEPSVAIGIPGEEARASGLVAALKEWVEGIGDGTSERLLWVAVPPVASSEDTNAELQNQAAHHFLSLVRQAFGQPDFRNTAVVDLLSGPPAATPEVAAADRRLAEQGRLIPITVLPELRGQGQTTPDPMTELRLAIGLSRSSEEETVRGWAILVAEELPEIFRRAGVRRIELP